MKTVEIFTDGACSGNPGPGGWGAILRYNGKTKELHGGEANTTNNRMELLAAITALDALKEPCEVLLHTDSKYVMDGISSWIHGWKRNGWKTADKKPVKNGELWQALDEANRRHKVTWRWVKGHAGHVENERADELARLGMAPFKPVRATPEPAARPQRQKSPGTNPTASKTAASKTLTAKTLATTPPDRPSRNREAAAKPKPRRSTQSY